jgi:protein-disulfide isomerase
MRRHLPLALAAALVVAFSPASVVAAAGPKQPSAVASIAGQPLTEAEFRKAAAAAMDALEKQQAAQREQLKTQHAQELAATRERELRTLLDQRALDLEGQKSGRSGLAVLGDLQVTLVDEADVKAFYLEHQSQIQQPYAAIRDQIAEMLQNQRTDLDTRRFTNGLWLKHGIKALDAPRRIDVPGSGPARGATKAPVTVIEFSDFQCPFCVRTVPEIQKLLATYPEQVRVAYRQLPLKTIHPQAQAAAEASLCANDQGKFWEMHDALFALNGKLQDASYGDLANKLGLKADDFAACMSQHTHAKTVDADTAAADAAGATGTPYLLVNGRSLNGAASFNDMAMLVEDELVRLGLASPVPVNVKPAQAPVPAAAAPAQAPTATTAVPAVKPAG